MSINRRAKELAQLAEVAYRTKLAEIARREKCMSGRVDRSTLETLVPRIDLEMGLAERPF